MERVKNGDGQPNLRVQLQLVAALGLLIMAIAAPIALQLLKSASSLDLIRLAVVLLVVVGTLDLIIAWSFWFVFEETQPRLSALAMVFRVLYTGLLLSSLGVYAPYLGQTGTGFEPGPVFAVFEAQWSLGLAIFGFHLVVLGYLFLKSKEFHFILGILIVVAGLGYTFDSMVKLLAPQSTVAVSSFTFVGEALLILWLPIHAIRHYRSLAKEVTGLQKGVQG